MTFNVIAKDAATPLVDVAILCTKYIPSSMQLILEFVGLPGPPFRCFHVKDADGNLFPDKTHVGSVVRNKDSVYATAAQLGNEAPL